MTPARPDADEPRPLRESLAEVSSQLGLPDPDAAGILTQRWEDVVGSVIAPHAHLRSLRDGVLTVVVDEAPWATQLRYLEGELVARAASLLGPEVVRSVRVSVASERR